MDNYFIAFGDLVKVWHLFIQWYGSTEKLLIMHVNFIFKKAVICWVISSHFWRCCTFRLSSWGASYTHCIFSCGLTTSIQPSQIPIPREWLIHSSIEDILKPPVLAGFILVGSSQPWCRGGGTRSCLNIMCPGFVDYPWEALPFLMGWWGLLWEEAAARQGVMDQKERWENCGW